MEIRKETDIKVQIRKTLFEIEQQKRARVQRFLLEIGLTPGQGQARILSSLAAVVLNKKRRNRCPLSCPRR